jgi:hypothetical protein
MQLYELREKTLGLLIALRKYGTIGPENYVRNNGKTTALLIYAKELVDTLSAGDTVIVACHSSLYVHRYRELFPQSVNNPTFVFSAPGPGYKNLHLLVDEPRLLKWNQHEWDYLTKRAKKIVSVGKAF